MRTDTEIQQLIEQYRPLSEVIVRRYTPRSEFHKDRDRWLSLGLVALWKSATDWEPQKAAFNTWLTWRIRSAVSGQLEKDRRQRKHLKQLASERDFDRSSPCPVAAAIQRESDSAHTKEAQWLLQQASLSPVQAELIDLLYGQGLSPSEAAERMGFSRQRAYTVRQLALKKLQRVKG